MSTGPDSAPRGRRLLTLLLQRVAFWVLMFACALPAGIAVVTDGELRQGVIIGAVLLGVTLLSGVALAVLREYRAERDSGGLEEARRWRALLDQRHAAVGPPPVAVRVAAALMFLTAALLALATAVSVVEGVRLGGTVLVAAFLLAGLLATLAFSGYRSGRTLLRHGKPGGAQFLHGGLAVLVAISTINRLLSNSPDKWLAILVILGISAFLAIPALLVQTPAAKAWVARHRAAVADIDPAA